jgi:exodeoxyribonuclease V beta subunit
VSRSVEFRADGALPSGPTVIEASAGTGKTYALAALATRFVAEQGVRPSELCIVSFTEAATAELRGRVRERLAGAAEHLAAGAPSVDDDVATHLGTLEDREGLHRNLDQAVGEFDTATIATIHGFCARLLGAGPGAEAATTVTDDRTTIAELVDDVVLARFGDGTPAPMTPDKLARAVELRLTLPGARFALPDLSLLPRDPTSDQLEQRRRAEHAAALVDEVVEMVHERRRRARRRTFDSLLTDTRTLLTGADGPATVAALRARFRVVLVDEFQDTDQVQWDIFRTAFVDGDRPATVVLVGDPKQSIYRFRSAELSAYLSARDLVTTAGGPLLSLAVNWRSDAGLLEGLDHLLRGATFGDDRVAFHSVTAGGDGARTPAGLGDGEAPLQLRCLDTEPENVPAARAEVLRDVVGEVVRLLDGSRTLADGRALRPSDIGVLVRSNADAARYARALAEAGVPAASSSNDSVADSEAADQWRTLLSALDRPGAAAPARAALLGWFLDGDPGTVAALDEPSITAVHEKLRGWSGDLAAGGLPRLVASLRHDGLRRRVLSRPNGTRDLTDLEHLAELLQSVLGRRAPTPATLLAALEALRDPESAGDTEALAPEVLARRIDSDDETVKVLTVHKAKGLEFGVVLCPTLWTQAGGVHGLPHASVGGERLIDADSLTLHAPTATAKSKSKAKPFATVKDADRVEREGEAKRLLYVALTRARHRLVVWWCPPGACTTERWPLGRLLAGAAGDELTVPALRAWAASTDGSIAVVAVGSAPPVAHHPPAPASTPLVVAHADCGHLADRRWRVWSFTAMAGAHRAADPGPAPGDADTGGVTGPPDGGTDERGPEPGDETAPTAPDDRLPLDGAPAGATFGTLVHGVLERTDFASTDLAAEVHGHAAEALRFRPLLEPEALVDGLVPALRAPLGGALGGQRLCDLARADRLDELRFDLALADTGSSAIAEVLVRHLDATDPLRPWAEALAGAPAVDVSGMLTGSIDLVARTGDAYWLADYKTNRLPHPAEGPALHRVMADHDYPLQATLYLVALHRYLRWRLAGYDPDHHLLGAAYLFLRAMDPARAASDARGVVWWRPPTAALLELDHLIATGSPR